MSSHWLETEYQRSQSELFRAGLRIKELEAKLAEAEALRDLMRRNYEEAEAEGDALRSRDPAEFTIEGKVLRAVEADYSDGWIVYCEWVKDA